MSSSTPRRQDLPLRHGVFAREIQRNVLSAFGAPFMSFVLLGVPDDVEHARAWLGEIYPRLAYGPAPSAAPEGKVRQALGLTWPGLRALGVPGVAKELDDAWAFRTGAARRAPALGESPADWRFGVERRPVGAVLTIAGADRNDVQRKAEQQVLAAGRQGMVVISVEHGALLRDNDQEQRSREPFGFRDGRSQPRVAGYDVAADSSHAVAPGEFLLGERRQDGTTLPCAPWARLASFQVLRRIKQDVGAWNAAAREAGDSPAQQLAWEERTIGRTKDGEYVSGAPASAHVAKMRPHGVPGVDPDRRRIIRRGVPFVDPDTAECGILFNAFMASIEGQYEYLQRLLANHVDVPDPGTGPDRLIGRTPDGYAGQALSPGSPMSPFVETQGAVYALAPSRSGLAWLARGGREARSSGVADWARRVRSGRADAPRS